MEPHVRKRALTKMERFFDERASKGGADTVLTVVTIEPPLEKAALHDAACFVQRRHPILQAALCSHEGKSYFEFGRAKPVEVREHLGTLEDAVDSELRNHPNGAQIGFHLALCGSHLLLTYHHSFIDGCSVMFILQDLLNELSGAASMPDDAGQQTPYFTKDPLCSTVAPLQRYDVLNSGEQVPFAGTWVPAFAESWWLPSFGYDPRTVHRWDGDGTCTWTTGWISGVGRVVGKCISKSDVSFSVEYTPNNAEGQRMSGTIRMSSDRHYYLCLDIHRGGGEYMQRFEGASRADLIPLTGSMQERRQQVPGCAVTCMSCVLAPWRGRTWTQFRAAGISGRRPPALEPAGLAGSPHPGRPRRRWRRLPASAAARLRARCRAEGASVQGALGAAAAAALRGVLGRAALFCTLVQTRGAHGAAPRSVGCFVSWIVHSVRTKGVFWDVARDYCMRIAAAQAAGIQFRALDHVGAEGSSGCLGNVAARVLGGAPPADVVLISNRGAFSLKTSSHIVCGVHVIQKWDAAEAGASLVRLNVSSVNDAMFLSLAFHCSFGSDQECTDFADALVLELEAAAHT